MRLKNKLSIFLFIYSITLFSVNIAVFLPNILTLENEKRSDNSIDVPIRLEGTVIDYYGKTPILRDESDDLTLKTSAESLPLEDNTILLKLEELAIIKSDGDGWALGNGLNNFTFDSILNSDGISDIQSIATGQFDSDSNEEFIIAEPTGKVVIFDDADNNYEVLFQYTFTSPWCGGDCSLQVKEVSVVAGNFDGVGTDEFALMLTEYDWDNIPWYDPDPDNFDSNIMLYIFEMTNNSIVYSDHLVPAFDAAEINDGGRSDHITAPEIRSGDVDGDGKDEIVMTTSGPAVYRGWVIEYDSTNDNYDTTQILNSDWDIYFPVSHGIDRHYAGHNPVENNIALGDVDGDGRDEIIYMVYTSAGATDSGAILILDDKINNYRQLRLINVAESSNYSLTGGLLESGDIDGDGIDEILVFSLYPGNTFGLVFDDFTTEFKIMKEWLPTDISSIVGNELTLADVDVDGIDEIIFSTGNGVPKLFSLELVGFSLVSTLSVIGDKTTVLDDYKQDFNLMYSNSTAKGFITGGEFNGDGIKVNYTGEQWETEASPKVIMVIAAPPTYDDISHNYASSYTAFGQEADSSVTTGNSISIMEGTHWSVGAEIDVSVFGFLSLEASVEFGKTITEEMSRTNSKTTTETVVTGYIVGAADDGVLYQITKFDNYKYEIISHPTNDSLIGEFITIDVPQESIPYKVSLPYFNSRVKSADYDIGEETFNHTAGKP